MGNVKEKLSSRELSSRVIREALQKNWPLPEGIDFDLTGVSVKGEVEDRSILVTRFNARELNEGNKQALLEVLSQKADGDVYLEGRVKLLFRQ